MRYEVSVNVLSLFLLERDACLLLSIVLAHELAQRVCCLGLRCHPIVCVFPVPRWLFVYEGIFLSLYFMLSSNFVCVAFVTNEKPNKLTVSC